MADRKAFDHAAIESIADVVGSVVPWQRIRELFHDRGYGDSHSGERPRDYVSRILKYMQEVERTREGVIAFLLDVCNPQAWVTRPREYEQLLKGVNGVLLFYGMSIGSDGRLETLGSATTTLNVPKSSDELRFEGRRFHRLVVRHARDPFCKGLHATAVFECCKAFERVVQANTGIADTGRGLMGSAFSAKGPIRVNSGLTDSEGDEQEGIQHLSMGLMAGIRNPQGHVPMLDWPISCDDALEMLGLVSFLFKKLEHSTIRTPTGSKSVVL